MGLWRESACGSPLITLGLVSSSLLLASCSTTPTPPSAAPPVTAPAAAEPVPSGGPGCIRSRAAARQPTEIRGDAGNAQLYGLVSSELPVRVGTLVKIVWRMRGSGPLTATATGPDGVSVPLEFGPEAHLSSTYVRPGDEWGTGYRFNKVGCWRLQLDRVDTHGEFWMNVIA